MAGKRTYDDGCAAAHALDMVGERWALLLVRELMHGPKRFSDLEASLPGASPNVLSQRLKDLENAGILRHQRLPPPASVWVYALTEWGLELEPVLQALGRWGARSPWLPREAPVSTSTLVMALRTMFDPGGTKGLSATFELRIGAERFQARVDSGQLEVVRGGIQQADAVLEGDVATLRGLIFAGEPVDQALRSGKLSLSGNEGLARRFLGLFKLPKPFEPAEPTRSA